MHKIRKPVLDVLKGCDPEHVPVWLMRQAGRYLPEYREIRAKSKNFLNMCLNPDLATEITLQPLRRFQMDAAILFADILLIPMALGLNLDFREGEGPVLEAINENNLGALTYTAHKVEAVFETVRCVKKELSEKTTFIGFCGSPWTVACYMIDGHSHTHFATAKEWVKHKDQSLDKLIAILIDASERYLISQIEAGVEVIQLFDSWAGLLSGQEFVRFVIEPTRQLVARLKKNYPDIPIIGFPREAGPGYASYIRETGVDALSLDQSVTFDEAKDLQKFKPLQGNLDPALLVKGGSEMQQALTSILTHMGPKHIVNLGHGVVPETPFEHVGDMVKFVQAFKL